MTPQDLLLMIFCTSDDEMKALGLTRLRSRGPRRTTPADSEVITIGIVGELWGLSDDKALCNFFRRYHAAEFPALGRVHRTTFAHQAANLCWAQRRLQSRWARRLTRPEDPWRVDSLPLPACRFARARTGRRCAGPAAWGFDPVAVKAFYGFRLHLRTSPDGVIPADQLAPADAAETAMIGEVVPTPIGVGLGDRNGSRWIAGWWSPSTCRKFLGGSHLSVWGRSHRPKVASRFSHKGLRRNLRLTTPQSVVSHRNYWSPALRAAFQAAAGWLVAPFKTARYDPDPRRSHWLLKLRRRIENAIGQLVERFDCRRIRVKDIWRLEHRVVRKILSHTVAIWLNVKEGHEPLQFDRLAA